MLGKRANQFISSLISVTNSNKLLAKADPATVVSSAMVAATLDLPINQSLGFAYIVPYKGQAQFQLGYKGMIQLAMRSGQFKTFNDFIVPSGALQDYDEMTGRISVDWSKGNDGKEPDGYGVYMALTNGFEKTVFWSFDKVTKHAKRFSQSYSKGYDSPWKSDFNAMALKTVIKHTLSKYAPLSVDMQKGIEADQGVVDLDGNVSAYPDNEPEAKEDPFKSAKKADAELVEKKETQAAPSKEEAKEPPSTEKQEAAPKTGTKSKVTAKPDDVAMLILDSEGKATDAAVTKGAIALGILPAGYKQSVSEASPEQLGAIVERFEEIVNLKMA